MPSEEEEEEEEVQVPEEGDIALVGEQVFGVEEVEEEEEVQRPGKKVTKMNVALRDVNISREGHVIVAGRDEVGRTELEEEEESEEELEVEVKAVREEELEEESSEYETSEDEKPKLQFRPVFVPKRGRVTVAEKLAIAADTEEALRKKEMEAEERRKQSHDMVAESIRRELAEKEKEEEVPDIDDSDALDPDAEFEAWRLRELARIKRDKEAEVARELEREEIERRRLMPEEQRLKEDLEHAKKLREEKPKGAQKFLQKYWHKGAFHQDEEILKRHDYTEATESTVDVSVLPQVMQVRNFGKRSRTKYTHLVDQDTTIVTGGFGGTGSVKVGGKGTDGGGCFICGGPHMKKDCPQNVGLAQVDLVRAQTQHRPGLGTTTKVHGETGTTGMHSEVATEISMTAQETKVRITTVGMTDMPVVRTGGMGPRRGTADTLGMTRTGMRGGAATGPSDGERVTIDIIEKDDVHGRGAWGTSGISGGGSSGTEMWFCICIDIQDC
ncbi:hypothetical protein EWM64_g3488 [Hericium alpestre]|uniref:Micro-fibrillar-associated protein 1 C-terminal domain-containing protein n=1 Tax=Hericium alpestre TaxID=135208 RepID=A0A4Z0A221_9AGAM|nr:hypothetical protein EWM64_g3488 [Hericium alpestre]